MFDSVPADGPHDPASILWQYLDAVIEDGDHCEWLVLMECSQRRPFKLAGSLPDNWQFLSARYLRNACPNLFDDDPDVCHRLMVRVVPIVSPPPLLEEQVGSIRPVLLILSAPLILLTLGLFILVVNGLLLRLVPTFVPGFHVDGFSSAFWGAIVIGIVSWMLSAFFRGSDGHVHVITHHNQIKRVHGRVIDPSESNLQ